jgi:ankyrin repeat protein
MKTIKLILVLTLLKTVLISSWTGAQACGKAIPDTPQNELTESTPVLLAAERGDLEAVRVLISHGAKVDERNTYGKTPLILAAMNGHTETAKLLLNNGAKIDERSDQGSTAFLLAALGGHIQTVELLLNSGARINERSKAANTALILAAWKGHTQLLEFLLKYALVHGPKNFDYWGHLNEGGKSAIAYAINYNHLGLVIVLFEHLLRYPGKRVVSKEVSKAIETAFQSNNREIIQYLYNLSDRIKKSIVYDAVKPSEKNHAIPTKICDEICEY